MANGLELKGAGSTIHLFKPRPRQPEVSDLHFVLNVDNYSDIAQAFGVHTADQVVQKAVGVLSDLFGEGGLAIREGGGLISALLWDSSLLGDGPVERACARFAHMLSAAIVLAPMSVGDQAVHASISCEWSRSGDANRTSGAAVRIGEAAAPLARPAFPGEVGADDQGWASRYRSDMAAAAEILKDVATRCVALAWQPVRSGVGDDDILYRECLPRVKGGVDCFAPAETIPALERLGLIRPLDHHVVTRAIDELDNDPAVTLGVNISAQSAVFDGWWLDIAERLARRRDIAHRLVLEITETTQFPCISDAIAFTDRMRKLGCRLALDGFGVGHSSIRHLLAFKPDIIKIDSFFLRRASLSDSDSAAFHHIVGLAKALAPVVVVDGSETEDMAEIARTAGARWQQGQFHGRPTIVRTWLVSDEIARIEALCQFQACFVRAAPAQTAGVKSS